MGMWHLVNPTSGQVSIMNAFQTKMWYSNLGKFRRVLVSVAENVCVSEGFG